MSRNRTGCSCPLSLLHVRPGPAPPSEPVDAAAGVVSSSCARWRPWAEADQCLRIVNGPRSCEGGLVSLLKAPGGERGTCSTAGGNARGCGRSGKQHGGSSKN